MLIGRCGSTATNIRIQRPDLVNSLQHIAGITREERVARWAQLSSTHQRSCHCWLPFTAGLACDAPKARASLL